MASISPRSGLVVEERLAIPHQGGAIEACLSYTPDADFCDGVLLVPPHPNFAGTMDNNVVRGLQDHLTKKRYLVLRFNYPGIGASSLPSDVGLSPFDFWDKQERAGDFSTALSCARAALRYMQSAFQPFLGRIHVAGYSYGAIVGLQLAAAISAIHSVAAISTPWLARYSYRFFENVACDTFFIQGDGDFVFDRAVFDTAWKLLPAHKEFHAMEGDHFFRQHEEQLARCVERCMARVGLLRFRRSCDTAANSKGCDA